MKVVQITTSVNWGAVGRIAEQIGEHVIANGGTSYIFYGRYSKASKSKSFSCSNKLSLAVNLFFSRVFDCEGLAAWLSTRFLIARLKKINPDIIQLHTLHGYYLNYNILFKYLNKRNIPIVWTFHDCWAFTGHCAHFVSANCCKWETMCCKCPLLGEYPKAILFDGSRRNYRKKKDLFTSNNNLHIVAVSEWMARLVKLSFFKDKDIKVIHNGIDLTVFKPYEREVKEQFIILGVASVWTEKKGLNDFFNLREILNSKVFNITLVGLNKEQLLSLPEGIIGIERTESIEELAKLYSSADVFVNLTYEDTFPTVNIESLACGTPVVTYNTGGSPEAIDSKTGFVVEQGNINKVASIIQSINSKHSEEKDEIRRLCRERAVMLFEKNARFKDYMQLYSSLLS